MSVHLRTSANAASAAFTQLRLTAGHLRDAVGDQGSPMLGRGAEFDTVLGLLDDTRQGQGRMLLVEGERGPRRRKPRDWGM